MRIVIDMQGVQTGSRYRGIGRYSMSLVKAMARNKGEHEIILALNAAFPESLEPIRTEFSQWIPSGNIHICPLLRATNWGDLASKPRREAAEKIWEAFLVSLRPDAILITSLFEGYSDDAVTSVGTFNRRIPVSAILYDLFPLTHPDKDHDHEAFRIGYTQKIAHLSRCRALLAISEYTRNEALKSLSFKPEDIVNISGACDPSFKKTQYKDREIIRFKSKFNITKPFVMYAGGADRRKNLPRLIEAYALMPDDLPRQHQLVIVGDMPQGHIDNLRRIAASANLSERDVLITGYVEEQELLQFYNTCELFVFPSLLEGLGLPPLEAMACGAPVIAANVASIPEIVNREDALFNPYVIKSISDKMVSALTNHEFRDSLIKDGYERVKQFSWDISAKKALTALERFAPSRALTYAEKAAAVRTPVFKKRRLSILVLKLDHIGDFILALPALSKLRARYPYADIDIAVGSWNASLAQKTGMFRNVYTFNYIKRDDRGVGKTDAVIRDFLTKLDEYNIAIDFRRQRDTRLILAKIRADLKVGYASFDEQIDHALDIVLPAYHDVPHVATPMNKTHISRQILALVDALPIDVNDFILFPSIGGEGEHVPGMVAVFPFAGNDAREWGTTKYAELVAMLAKEGQVQRVTVFLTNDDERERYGVQNSDKVSICVGMQLPEMIQALSENTVCVANNSGGAHLASYLGLATVAIYSGQETTEEWAPPVGDVCIVSRNAFCTPCHIPSKAKCSREFFCLNDISVESVFNCVMEAVTDTANIEKGQSKSAPQPRFESTDALVDRLIVSIAQSENIPEESLLSISTSIAEAFIPPEPDRRRIFVDITEFAKTNAGTGIQRVVKNVFDNMWSLLPEGWEVVPVYHRPGDSAFRKAAKFFYGYFGYDMPGARDDVFIQGRAGDVFFGLDLNLADLGGYDEILTHMRDSGVRVEFLVHDLLCISMPQYFDHELVVHFARWLKLITKGDGAICVSKATADDLSRWVNKNAPKRTSDFMIRYVHNGADFANPHSSSGLPKGAETVLGKIQERPSFLMVSTLEPRKGHAQVLSAFQTLWEKENDVNLVIVGKQGWMVDDLVSTIKKNPRLNERLFWLQGISDEYLNKIYSACSCLITASEGEGFGLFLVEAAQHKIPIIARDIPVFREIAGAHAYYFKGKSPEALVKAVEAWTELRKAGKHPRSDEMAWQTWRQSAAKTMKFICGER